MSEFEAERLFDRTLPEASAWVLEALFTIDELRSGPAFTKLERHAAATALYRKVIAGLEPLREPLPDEHRHDALTFRSWFIEAVLLWLRFARTGSVPLVDTLGAETLRQFPVDLPLDAQAAAQMRAALSRAFALTGTELEAAEHRAEHLTSNLELKHRITLALAGLLLEPERAGPAGRVALLHEFYGVVPFRPGDVEIVIASTSLFFFVPRKGSLLDVSDWHQRSPRERQAIAAFFAKLDRANTAETRRFPAFGLYEAEALQSSLVARIAALCGAPPSVTRSTLATMFSLIPKALHAQYLVHDLWGHGWQEALNEFEEEYALLPYLDRPLGPDDGPPFGGPATAKLASAFVARNGVTHLDEARLLAFGEADLRGRIQVATSIAFSEVLADFMEAKFSRSRPALELPTTSLIPSTSLKLDLTIVDTRAQVRRYTKPYRNLAVDPEAQARLAQELALLGLPAPGLDEAVARAGRLLFLNFAPAFDDGLVPEPASAEGGALRSSVLRRLLLQFALVMADFERVLAGLESSSGPERWRDPGRCPDFFAVAFSHFYEQDRQRNFWHIDQLARSEFSQACDRLKQALEAAEPPSDVP